MSVDERMVHDIVQKVYETCDSILDDHWNYNIDYFAVKGAVADKFMSEFCPHVNILPSLLIISDGRILSNQNLNF